MPLGETDFVADAAMAEAPYEDATYWYDYVAMPGSALTSAVWRGSRTHKITFHKQYVDGGRFSQVATNLATVALLTYS